MTGPRTPRRVDPREPVDRREPVKPVDPVDEPVGADAGNDLDPDTTDTTPEVPGRAALPAEVPNDDLAPSRADPDAGEPASDRDPGAEDADFDGRPLTDEEIDALPPDDAEEDI